VAAGVATPFLLPVDAQRFLPTADGGAYFESFADGLFRLSPDGTVATVAGTENSYFWSMWVGTGGYRRARRTLGGRSVEVRRRWGAVGRGCLGAPPPGELPAVG